MCGIVGIVNVDGQPVQTDLLARMRDSMVHRGPDDQGLWVEDGVGLGHRRLSILDLSPAGHQPMTADEGDLWLTFNGEIFNYIELTEELQALGHTFRSKCDSEVILHLYQEFGADCVDRMNGMFGFAIWDRKRRTLFASRDRLGIKPFYYLWTGRRLVFASEIKAILEDPGVRREANDRAVADYLYCGRPLAGRTFFSGIVELLPGHSLLLEGGSLRTWSYWDLDYDYRYDRRDHEVVDEIADLIDDAVRIHCRSDAPLGCHLSGGLDSSTVTCVTAKHRKGVKSFSIYSPGGAFFDETPYAKAVQRHASTEYLEAVVDAHEIDRLTPRLVWNMDMPMANPGGVNYYVASRLAADHVKVSLTGHGGDEVFAGYPAQFLVAFGTTSMFDSGTGRERPDTSVYHRLRNLLHREGLAGVVRRVRDRLLPGPTPSPEQLWIRSHCGSSLAANPQVHPQFLERLGGFAPEADYLAAFRGARTDQVFDRCLHHDLRCYLPSLLHMEDRVSMAVSVESRVPLLDHRLVEALARVPPEQRVRDRVPKRLLREAGKRWLPEEVLDRRDKAGFPTPNWFKRELSGDLRRILGSKRSRERGVLDPAMLGDRSFWMTDGWKGLNIELWYRIFIDGDLDPGTPLSEIE